MTTYSLDQNLRTTDEVRFNGLDLTGTLAMDGAAINEAEEFELTSATETDIGAAPSNNVRITGETQIESFGIAAAGINRLVRFAGSLTLKHSADIVLPGGVDIETAAGDFLIAENMDDAGHWRVAFYQPAAGAGPVAAITSGTLDSVTITNSTFVADSFKIEDPSGDDTLSLATTELTADRTFTIDPADGNRTLTVSADTALNQNVTTSSSPQFTAVNVGHASDTTVSRAAAGTIAVEGISVLASNATGIQTFLTAPSSANFAAAVTDEVGSGSVVFGNQAVSTDSVVTFAGLATAGYKRQSFVFRMQNSGGTLQHAIQADRQSGASSGLADKINAANSTFQNTPTGTDGSTAMAFGGKIGSSQTERFYFDTAAQVAAAWPGGTLSVVYNDTGTHLLVDLILQSIDINGTTRVRPVLRFSNGTAGTAFPLTTANIGSNKEIALRLDTWVL